MSVDKDLGKTAKKCLTIKNEKMILIFCLFMGISFFVFATLLVIDRDGKQSEVIFGKGNNFFADFFNVAKYVSERDPYHHPLNGPAEKAYFPFTYLLYYPLSRLSNYRNLDPWQAGFATLGIYSAILTLFSFSLAAFLLLFCAKNGNNLTRASVVFSLFVSGTFIFTLERGNFIILTMFLLSIFILYYESKLPVIREISYIALALSAALKGYPALFGILLIYKKQWGSALRTAIYSCVAIVLPFMFFKNGFADIHVLIENLKISTEQYRNVVNYKYGLTYLIVKIFGVSVADTASVCELISKIMVLLSFIIAPFFKKKWKTIGLLTCVLIMFPVNSAYYAGIYLFPVIVLYLNEIEYKIADIIYIILFLLILTPLQFSSASLFLPNLMGFCLWIYLLAQGGSEAAGKIQKVLREKAKDIS